MIFFDNIKRMLESLFWNKTKPPISSKNIQESMSFVDNMNLSEVFYNGDTYEIQQVIRQIQNINKDNFYKLPSKHFLRVHSSLNSDVIDTITNITLDSYNQIEIDNKVYEDLLNQIITYNNIEENKKIYIKKTLIKGDGGFKVGFFFEENNLPQITFYEGNEIELIYEHNKYKEAIIKNKIEKNNKNYFLFETYGWGYIKYTLYDNNGKEIPLSFLYQDLEDVEFDKSINLFIPLKFFESNRYRGRGKVLFEGRWDLLSELDETISTLLVEMRNTKSNLFIDDKLIPKDQYGRTLLNFTELETKYTPVRMTSSSLNGGSDENHIVSKQMQFKITEYSEALMKMKEEIVQGIISLSDLSLDNKKYVESGVSQEEKSKTTGYTISTIQNELNLCFKQLFKMAIVSYYYFNNRTLINTDFEVETKFNQFNKSEFISSLGAVGTGKTQGIISTYQAIKDLRKDWDEEQIQEELKRINEDRGAILDDPFEKYTEDFQDKNLIDEEEVVEEEAKEKQT